jgi:hypothetical protein
MCGAQNHVKGKKESQKKQKKTNEFNSKGFNFTNSKKK